jgi:hypothetical protein
MNLKSFFDLDKVVFTDSELELPYESFDFSKVGQNDFSYSQTSSYSYTSLGSFVKDNKIEKVTLNQEEHALSGVAA